MAEPGLAVGAADRRREPGPGAEVARAGEALDLADLGDDQHRDVAPDPTQLSQHLDARVVLCQPVDFCGQRVDLAIEVANQAQQQLEPVARLWAQRQLLEGHLAGAPEQIGMVVSDALTREQRMHPVLQRGAHLRQHHALAQQVAQIAQVARRDISLGQQVSAQQMGQRARVDRVSLDPRRGDRLGPSGCARCSS